MVHSPRSISATDSAATPTASGGCWAGSSGWASGDMERRGGAEKRKETFLPCASSLGGANPSAPSVRSVIDIKNSSAAGHLGPAGRAPRSVPPACDPMLLPQFCVAQHCEGAIEIMVCFKFVLYRVHSSMRRIIITGGAAASSCCVGTQKTETSIGLMSFFFNCTNHETIYIFLIRNTAMRCSGKRSVGGKDSGGDAGGATAPGSHTSSKLSPAASSSSKNSISRRSYLCLVWQ